MGQDAIAIAPPNLEDYSSEEVDEEGEGEGDARPLTLDELKLRTVKGLQRKQTREAKQGVLGGAGAAAGAKRKPQQGARK